MKHGQIGRHSVSTVLVLGFAVTLGLWLYTGFAFTQRINSMEREAAEAASRWSSAAEPGLQQSIAHADR